jgi:hypothetical protein
MQMTSSVLLVDGEQINFIVNGELNAITKNYSWNTAKK